MNYLKATGFFLLCFFGLLEVSVAEVPPQLQTFDQEYAEAVKEAHQQHLPSKLLETLTKGSVVEMVTWTTHEYSEGFQVLNHQVWSVKASEMKAHCPQILAAADPALRVSQLLGMPPQHHEGSVSHFVILKVPVDVYFFKPSNVLVGEVIRPCFSSGDVSSHVCHYLQADEDKNTLPPYKKWITQIQLETKAYPWTGLGYTYDWNPQNLSHVGLSEFILPAGATVQVERSLSDVEFCSSAPISIPA